MEKVQFGTTVMPETAEAIDRLAKVEGVGKGELIDIAIAAYDAEPKVMEKAEIPDDATLVIAIPKDIAMLRDAFGNIIAACAGEIHPDDIWKAFAWTRGTFQKALPEFKSAERMRAEWNARREAGTRPLTYTTKGPSLK